MRTRLVAILLCAFAISKAYEASAQPPEPPELTCESLEQYLVLLQKPFPCMPDCPGGDPLDYGFIHDQGGYFSLPAQFEKFGRPGVLALLELLKQPNLSIRARAGMVLSVSSALTPEDLPAILQESRNGNDWITPALARIKTPEAPSELVAMLRKTPDLYSPPRSALKQLGNEAMPLLLEALSCKTDQDCDEDFVRAIGELASEPGIKSEQIQKRLIDIATAREQFTDARVGALRGLKQLKPDKESDRSRVRNLLNDPVAKVSRQAKATLIAWADETAPMLEPSDCAIYYTRHDNSGNLVAKGCKTYSEFSSSALKEDRLDNIGALGPAGRKHTPYVLELLNDEDWRVRAEAAKTLGRTGETSAIPNLIDAIGARDWKLTLEAIASLKQLDAAEDKIRGVAQNYWQPGIRTAAQRLLDGEPEPTVPGRGWKYWSPIDAYCHSDDGKKRDSQSGWRLTSHPDLFGAREVGSTAAVEGGTLVAIDKGEWGGALEFRPNSDLSQQLLHTQEPIKEESVSAVVKSSQGTFALTGSGHMGLDDGYIYQIENTADGKWSGHIVWRLPGAPRRVTVSPTGILGIQTDYGDVIFRPGKGMEWISCPARE